MFKVVNIFSNFGKRFINSVNTDVAIKHQTNPAVINNNPMNINDRLGQIYGDELIKLQLLYEKWVTKDTWLLKDEALPLLMALDPEKSLDIDPATETALGEMWIHAGSCVEQGLLKVTNREDVPEKWRVRPIDIYRWAKISRLSFPDIFTNLMEFVVNTVKLADSESQNNLQGSPDMTAIKFDQNREKVLGMALAILAAYPEQCRNSKGRVKVDRIINIINEKGTYWLGEEELEMSTTAMKDLINKWLNTTTI